MLPGVPHVEARLRARPWISEEGARSGPTSSCWRTVRRSLLAAASRPDAACAARRRRGRSRPAECAAAPRALQITREPPTVRGSMHLHRGSSQAGRVCGRHGTALRVTVTQRRSDLRAPAALARPLSRIDGSPAPKASWTGSSAARWPLAQSGACIRTRPARTRYSSTRTSIPTTPGSCRGRRRSSSLGLGEEGKLRPFDLVDDGAPGRDRLGAARWPNSRRCAVPSFSSSPRR